MVEKQTIARVLLALKKLSSSGALEKEKFLKEAGISPKTFKRLLEDLRNELELPIVYDIKVKKYVLDHSSDLKNNDKNILYMLKSLSSKNELLFFYSFVKSMIESEYFFPPLNTKAEGEKVSDYSQILRVLEKFIPKEDLFLSRHIGYYLSEHYKTNLKLKYRNMIGSVMTALRAKKYLRFTYNSAKVLVKPVKLLYYHGKWYLIGIRKESSKAPEKDVQRTYNLSHIKYIQTSNRDFTHLEDPGIEQKRSFGLFLDECCSHAVIRFYSPQVIRDMKEIIWSEEQKMSTGADKKRGDYLQIELEYPNSGAVELCARVLRFGRNAEILEPKPLVKMWKDEIRAMYRKYIK